MKSGMILRTVLLSGILGIASSFGAAAQAVILPSANDASANWKMAGMQSVGGIPNRTTVCATVNPLGSAQDDTTNIQNAIAACPLGQVVHTRSRHIHHC